MLGGADSGLVGSFPWRGSVFPVSAEEASTVETSPANPSDVLRKPHRSAPPIVKPTRLGSGLSACCPVAELALLPSVCSGVGDAHLSSGTHV